MAPAHASPKLPGAGPPPTGDGIGRTADWSNIYAEQTPGGDGIGKTADWTDIDTELRPTAPDVTKTRQLSAEEARPDKPGRPAWDDLLD